MKIYKNTRELVIRMVELLIQDEEEFMAKMNSLDCTSSVVYSEGKIAAYKLVLSDLEAKVKE